MVPLRSQILISDQKFTNESCTTVVRNERENVLFVSVEGRYTGEAARHVVSAMDLFLPQAPLAIFADFQAIASYESAARALMTDWCVTHRSKIRFAHTLSEKGLVRMGIATAAMTLSLVGLRLDSHSDRKRFQEIYRECLRSPIDRLASR